MRKTKKRNTKRNNKRRIKKNNKRRTKRNNKRRSKRNNKRRTRKYNQSGGVVTGAVIILFAGFALLVWAFYEKGYKEGKTIREINEKLSRVWQF